MTLEAADVAKALTLTQIAQAITSLGIALTNAIAGGRDTVTEDDLNLAFANKDEALRALDAAIARAKAEGR